MITLTREEAQQVLDALCELEHDTFHPAKVFKHKPNINLLRAKLSAPEPEREQCDMPCIEDDGCPTEKAVLQRFWRKHRQLEPKPVAWGVDEGEGRCISLHDLYFVKADADHMAELKGTHAKVVPLYTAPPQRDVIALPTGLHPRGKRVTADISEDSLETVEIEAPVKIDDDYVRTYLWEHNLVAIDEGDLKRLKQPKKLLAIPALMEQAGWVRKREWQGLTDEEIAEVLDYGQYGRVPEYARNFVDAIEAKLREKNGNL